MSSDLSFQRPTLVPIRKRSESFSSENDISSISSVSSSIQTLSTRRELIEEQLLTEGNGKIEDPKSGLMLRPLWSLENANKFERVQILSEVFEEEEVRREQKKKSKENCPLVSKVGKYFYSEFQGTARSYTLVINEDLQNERLTQQFAARYMEVNKSRISTILKNPNEYRGENGRQKSVLYHNKDVFKNIHRVNHLAQEMELSLNRSELRQVIHDILRFNQVEKNDYPADKTIEKFIREQFVSYVPCDQYDTRHVAEMDPRNFVSLISILEFCHIDGIKKVVKRDGKSVEEHHPYLPFKISNFDQTSTVLSNKIKDKKLSKVYLSKGMGNGKGNVKKSSTSKADFFRTKTHVSTSANGSLDFVAIVVKGKFKKTISTTTKQFSAKDSRWLRDLDERQDSSNDDQSEAADFSDRTEDEDDDNDDNDDVRSATAMDTDEAEGNNDYTYYFEEELTEEEEEEESLLNKDTYTMEELNNHGRLLEQVVFQMMPNWVDSSRNEDYDNPCQAALIFVPALLPERYVVEIIYTKGIFPALEKQIGREQIIPTQQDLSLKEIEAIDTERELRNLPSLHTFDGDYPQIQFFLHEETKRYLKEKKIIALKFPAKLTAIVQPNDRMVGFKQMKIPIPRDKKSHDLIACNMFLERRLDSLISSKLCIKSKQKNLFVEFLKYGGSVFANAFSQNKIRQGYRLAGIFPWDPKYMLKQCKLQGLNVDITYNLIERNRPEIYDAIQSYGILPDEVMDRIGVECLNVKCVDREEKKKLESLLADSLEVYDIPEEDKMQYSDESFNLVNSFESCFTKQLLKLGLILPTVESNNRNGRRVNVSTPDNQHRASMIAHEGYSRIRVARRNNRLREIERKEQEKQRVKEIKRKYTEIKKMKEEILKDANPNNTLFSCDSCGWTFDVANDINDSPYKEILEKESYDREKIDLTKFIFYHQYRQFRSRVLCNFCQIHVNQHGEEERTTIIYDSHVRLCQTVCKKQKSLTCQEYLDKIDKEKED